MNQQQAIQQVTEVAVWARETAQTHYPHEREPGAFEAWTDLADAADDLAAMIERDTFARRG